MTQFAAGSPEIVGPLLLILMPLAVAGRLMLPALSVHVPDADWFAPLVVNTTSGTQPSTPESASIPLKLTVTSEWFHPLASGPGEALALATGRVLSILTTGDVIVAELPAASLTTIFWLMFAPSV